MKRILLTGGPTNEKIDEVMKITNMSTGSLSLDLAKAALDKGDCVTLIVNKSVLGSARFDRYGFGENDPMLKVVAVESTQDMYDTLEAEGKSGLHYDVIIHASAVGDYKPEYTFRLEDMSAELADAVLAAGETDRDALAGLILKTMADPKCRVKDDSKISSYEPHLTVKLTLTTKLIANLRRWFPDALLVGCKLLENVTIEHLTEVAQKLAVKNDMDYIMANDLAQIRAGQPVRYLVTQEGYTGIALNSEGGPALLDYIKDNWF